MAAIVVSRVRVVERLTVTYGTFFVGCEAVGVGRVVACDAFGGAVALCAYSACEVCDLVWFGVVCYGVCMGVEVVPCPILCFIVDADSWTSVVNVRDGTGVVCVHVVVVCTWNVEFLV